MADEQASSVAGRQLIGAQALIASLAGAGVDVCFMNPGTSEMHFVHSLDTVPGMRGVLGLFEGVATGAADGYARISGRPAAVLLHLGPGLGNGLANLHNARRAHSPVVCIVGAHATGHVRYDAPLESDIEALARTVSGWVHTSGTTRAVARDAMRAVQASGRDGGQVATLVLPADVSWSQGGVLADPRPAVRLDPAAEHAVGAVADIVRGASRSMLLLGGRALTERGLRAASRVAAATGVQLLAETFPARMECGTGRPTDSRLAYMAEQADAQLAGLEDLILAGARSPVSFFAYPGRSSDLVPDGCAVTQLADTAQDVEDALEQLAERVAPDTEPVLAPAGPAPAGLAEIAGPGPLTVRSLAAAIAVTLPEQAIVVDEANTSGIGLPAALAEAPRHSLLTLTGGAIGQGLPVATGAAVAAPDRRVVCLEADGSALYTIQALWTQARERQRRLRLSSLNTNSSYAVLRIELAKWSAGLRPGSARPACCPWPTSAATSPASAAAWACPLPASPPPASSRRHCASAHAAPGPHLIEAIHPPIA